MSLEGLAEGAVYYSAVVAASSALYTCFLARARGVLEEGSPTAFLMVSISLEVYTIIYTSSSLLLRYGALLRGRMPDVALYIAAILVLVLAVGVALGSRTVCGALSVLGPGVMRRALRVVDGGGVEGSRYWLCSRCPVGVFTAFAGRGVYVHARVAEALSRGELKSLVAREALRGEDLFFGVLDAAGTLSWCSAALLFAVLSVCIPGIHVGAYFNAAAATVVASTVGWMREHVADLRYAAVSDPGPLLSAIAKAHRVALEEARGAVEKRVGATEVAHSSDLRCVGDATRRTLVEYFASLVAPSLVLHVRRDPPPTLRAEAVCGMRRLSI